MDKFPDAVSQFSSETEIRQHAPEAVHRDTPDTPSSSYFHEDESTTTATTLSSEGEDSQDSVTIDPVVISPELSSAPVEDSSHLSNVVANTGSSLPLFDSNSISLDEKPETFSSSTTMGLAELARFGQVPELGESEANRIGQSTSIIGNLPKRTKNNNNNNSPSIPFSSEDSIASLHSARNPIFNPSEASLLDLDLDIAFTDIPNSSSNESEPTSAFAHSSPSSPKDRQPLLISSTNTVIDSENESLGLTDSSNIASPAPSRSTPASQAIITQRRTCTLKQQYADATFPSPAVGLSLSMSTSFNKHGKSQGSIAPLSTTSCSQSTSTPMPTPSVATSMSLNSHKDENFDIGPEEAHLDYVSMQGYRDTGLLFTYHVCACIILSVLYALFWAWFPEIWARFRYEEVTDFKLAQFIHIRDKQNRWTLCRIERLRTVANYEETNPSVTADKEAQKDSILNVPCEDRMIVFRNRRYIYSTSKNTFILLRCPVSFLVADIKDASAGAGFVGAEYEAEKRLFGLNTLYIPVPSVIFLFITEILRPFFVSQVYSVIVWYCENYYVFAIVIGFMAAASIGITIYDTRQSVYKLQELARTVTFVTVIRDGVPKEINADELVPGDLVELNECIDVPCDLSLLTGSCVVNESMLTGESVPVIKFPLIDASDINGEDFGDVNLNDRMEVGKDPRTTLFAGSFIMQLKKPMATRMGASKPTAGDPTEGDPIYALVVRTGFATTKGNMISSMLYPPKSSFKFEQQSYRFIGVLFILAIIGCIVAFWKYKELGAPNSTISLRALDLVTIVVPPSLPLAMSIGTNFSIVQLRKLKIFCIAPSRVNFAGKIKLMCFDKTGTLTSDSLEYKGVHSFVNLDHTPFINPSGIYSKDIANVDSRTTRKNVNHNEDEDENIIAMEMDHKSNNAYLGTYVSPLVSPASLNGEPGVIPVLSAQGDFTFDKCTLNPKIRSCLATCHSLALHEGEFLGDPLEIEGYAASSAKFDEPKVKGVIFHSRLLKNIPVRTKKYRRSDADSKENDELKARVAISVADQAEDSVTNLTDTDSAISIRDSTHDGDDNEDIEEVASCLCDCHFYSNYFYSKVNSGVGSGYSHVFCDCSCAGEATISNFTLPLIGENLDEEKKEENEISPIIMKPAISHYYTGESQVAVCRPRTTQSILPSIESLSTTSTSTSTLPTSSIIVNEADAAIIPDAAICGLGADGRAWSVIKQFPFESQLQRMSVLAVNELDGSLHVFAKGAPEMIAKLADPSTVPSDYADMVDKYTNEGYRVIALATKPYNFEGVHISPTSPLSTNPTSSDSDEVETDVRANAYIDACTSRLANCDFTELRASAESGLKMLGLFVLENSLKPATQPTILKLNRAKIRSVMVTGDNVKTAVSISKQCGIVDNTCAVFLSHLRKSADGTPLPNPHTSDIEWVCHHDPTFKLDPYLFSILPPEGSLDNIPDSSRLGKLGFSTYELAVTGDCYAVLVNDHNARIDALAAFQADGGKANDFQYEEYLLKKHDAEKTARNNLLRLEEQKDQSFPFSVAVDKVNDSQFEEHLLEDANEVPTNQEQPMSAAVALARGVDSSSPIAQAMLAFEWPHMKTLDIATPLQRVVLGGCVFARMTPDQKASLVSHYQKLGMYTGMCGDGANDCGALKTAHVGVSLAESEASIAAPFTSQIADISCIPIVLLEGRSALATCFQLFKFVSLYSCIQFCACICLYFKGANFCDYQFLYQDMFAMFPLSILMGSTPAGKNLTSKRPSGNLLSKINLTSLGLHMLTVAGFQIFLYNFTQYQDGYQTFDNSNWTCFIWEATSIHYFTCFQYVLFSAIFSISIPWKRIPLYNIGLMTGLILSTIFSFCLLWFGPSKASGWYFLVRDDMWMPHKWRGIILLIMLGHIAVTLIVEYVIIGSLRRLGNRVYASRRTNTTFGKGSDRLDQGAKPYHLLRREFESNFPQNYAAPISYVSKRV